jgi:hypothetical protein
MLIEVLTQANCSPRNYGSYLTCKAIYRGGNDPGSIGIYPSQNIAKDFVTGKVFSLEEFLALTLGKKSIAQIDKILDDKSCYFDSSDNDLNPFSNVVKFYSKEDTLKDNHSYWDSRSVPSEIVQTFEGGLCLEGKMANRYVFPIYNAYKKIVGFSGRDVSGKSKIKWKHIGHKSEWAYPFYFNHKIIREKKQLILVESIGDMLSLWRTNIKEIGITFGTDMGKGLMKAIIRLDPAKIIIATNNDKNSAGQRASRKIKNKLLEFFDEGQIKIKLPFRNDFGEQSDEENLKWYNSIP